MDFNQESGTENALGDIPFAALKTIFQLGNTHIYEVSSNNEQVNDPVAITGAAIHVAGLSRESDFLQGSTIHDITTHYAIEPQGGFVIGITYKLDEKGSASNNRFSLTIGRIETNEDEGEPYDFITPHYILNGYIENNSFFPDEAICLVEEEGTELKSFVRVTDWHNFYATLCYADSAFKDVISGNSPSIQDSQLWIDVRNYNLVAKRFNQISHRSARNLSTELSDRFQPHNYSQTYIMPEPTMHQ